MTVSYLRADCLSDTEGGTKGYAMSMSKHHQASGWVQSASSVQSLSELWNSTAARVDHSNMSRSARAYIQQLCDAYLSGREKTGLLAVSRCAALLEKIAEAYPDHCPVLLLWATWNKNRSRALAHSLIRRVAPRTIGEAKRAISEYPFPRSPEFGSTSHKCLAAWFYAYRGKQRASGAVRGQVFPAFHVKS